MQTPRDKGVLHFKSEAVPYPNVEPRYFAALFRTGDYMVEIDSASRGIVKDRNRLYWDQFKQMRSPCPPPADQEAIVRFLEWATRRLERTIRAKREVITLLTEQKQAITRRAVTSGLDSSAPLKPTGIAWLGDVPKHWEVVALARLSLSRCDGPFGSGLKSHHYTESGVRVIRLQNIGNDEYRDRVAAFISAEHYSTLGDHGVNEGDLLIAGLGDEKMPAGRACIAPGALGRAMVKADCFRFRLRTDRVVPRFLSMHLSATAAAATACLSTGATRLRINLQATAARAVALPPFEEQQRIVASVERAAAPLNVAVGRLENEIKLLREYRTRLFADVVGGRLDVRGAAARLPDEPEPHADVGPSDGVDERDLIDEEAAEA